MTSLHEVNFLLLALRAASTRVIPTLRFIYTKKRLIILSRIARVRHTAAIRRRGRHQVRVGHRKSPSRIARRISSCSWRRGVMKKKACSSIKKLLKTASLSGVSWDRARLQKLRAISDHSRPIGPSFRRGFNETQILHPQLTRHNGNESKPM